MVERLLKLAGPLHVAVGLSLFLSAFSTNAREGLASFFGAPPDHPWSPFFIAIFGPTIASWGVLFTGVVRQFYLAPSPGLWKIMVLAIAIWAPLDTGLCVYFGLWQAALLNLIVIIGFVVLLVAARGVAKVNIHDGKDEGVCKL